MEWDPRSSKRVLKFHPGLPPQYPGFLRPATNMEHPSELHTYEVVNLPHIAKPSYQGIVARCPTPGPYRDLRFIGLPIASRKMAALPVACGEKKLITSPSKKVSPVAPKPWAYADR